MASQSFDPKTDDIPRRCHQRLNPLVRADAGDLRLLEVSMELIRRFTIINSNSLDRVLGVLNFMSGTPIRRGTKVFRADKIYLYCNSNFLVFKEKGDQAQDPNGNPVFVGGQPLPIQQIANYIAALEDVDTG
jgi:hypothetical protein